MVLRSGIDWETRYVRPLYIWCGFEERKVDKGYRRERVGTRVVTIVGRSKRRGPEGVVSVPR